MKGSRRVGLVRAQGVTDEKSAHAWVATPVGRELCESPHMAAYRAFLTPAVCTHLVARAAPNHDPAYIAAFENIYPALAAKYRAPLYPFFLDGVAAVTVAQ